MIRPGQDFSGQLVPGVEVKPIVYSSLENNPVNQFSLN